MLIIDLNIKSDHITFFVSGLFLSMFMLSSKECKNKNRSDGVRVSRN